MINYFKWLNIYNNNVLPTNHERQSHMIDKSTTDFCQDSVVSGMRVASCVEGCCGHRWILQRPFFSQQMNITAVQMQPESIAIMSQTDNRLWVPQRQLTPSTTLTTDHEVIDTLAFECDQLFIEDNGYMTNDAAQRNASIAPWPLAPSALVSTDC